MSDTGSDDDNVVRFSGGRGTPPPPPPLDPGMEARVAVLEEIAKSTKSALERIERRLDDAMKEGRSDNRWLLGIMLTTFAGLLAAMAHGFHWL